MSGHKNKHEEDEHDAARKGGGGADCDNDDKGGKDSKDKDHQKDSKDAKDHQASDSVSVSVASAAKVAALATFVSKELLIDGSFEQSKAADKDWTHSKTVGGWKSDTEIETWGKDFYGLKAAEGSKFAELDYDNRASNIYQDVKTEAGAEYTFGFDYAQRPDSKAGSDTINVYWNDKLVGTVDPKSSAWAHAEFKVQGTGGTDRIEFRESAEDNDSYGGLLDNASLKQSGPSTEQQKAADKAAVDKAAADKAAADKAAKDKAAADKAAADKAAADKAAKDKAAADKAAADKAAADKAAKDKAAADKAAADKAAADKAAKDKAAADKAAADKAAADKAAADKAAADKAAADKAAADKAAADKAAADKAAADKEAADKAAAEKVAADKAAADKEAADAAQKEADAKCAEEAAQKQAAEQAAREKEAFDKANADAAAKDAADKAAADAAAKDAADKAAADAAAKEAADKAAADAAAKDAADKAAAEAAAKDADNTPTGDTAHKADIVLDTADVNDVVKGKTLNGSKSADAIHGGKGSDVLMGRDGDDVISGDDDGGVTVALKIGASLSNALDANAVSIDLSGIPEDAELSAGVRNANGTWTLKHSELAGLTVTTPDSRDFDVSVKASATDGSGLSASATIHVSMQTNADDTLVGGKGNDTLSGEQGDDVIYGGSIPTGNATPHVVTYADNDKLYGGAGNDKMYGNTGDDFLDGGKGNDWLSGGKGNDTLTGGDGTNTLYGNSGDDLFIAAGGNDTVVGGSGFDTIDFSAATGGVMVNLHAHTMSGFGTGSISGVEAVIGSKFDDVFTADSKVNVFTGGEGNDTFVWGYSDSKRGADTITDFNVGDRVDLHAVTKGDSSRLMLKDDGTDTHVFAMVDKSWVEVVKLDGYTGHSQEQMLKDGAILV